VLVPVIKWKQPARPKNAKSIMLVQKTFLGFILLSSMLKTLASKVGSAVEIGFNNDS